MNSQHGTFFKQRQKVCKNSQMTARRNRLLSLASHLTLLKKAQSFNLQFLNIPRGKFSRLINSLLPVCAPLLSRRPSHPRDLLLSGEEARSLSERISFNFKYIYVHILKVENRRCISDKLKRRISLSIKRKKKNIGNIQREFKKNHKTLGNRLRC